MYTLKHSTLACIAMLTILAADVTAMIGRAAGVTNGSTSAILLLNVLASVVLIYLAGRTKWGRLFPKPAQITLFLFLGWGLAVLTHGAFSQVDYWGWKVLLTRHAFIYLIPLAIAIGASGAYFARVSALARLFVIPVALALLPLSLTQRPELFQRVAMPLYLLVLLAPFLRRRWLPILLAIALVSIGTETGYRSNVLRLGVATALAAACVLRFRFRPKLLNTFGIISFVLPLVLLGLGLAGQYNWFRDEIRIEGPPFVVIDAKVGRGELEADTRTFLYDEVFASMKRRDSSFLLGQGAGTGYESRYFARELLGSEGRFGSEVGFLNVLLYSGVVGVALYGAMLALAAFYAFNRSNNDLCKLLGAFLMFKWALFFLEDIPQMDLNYFCTWVMIGFCVSKQARWLNNAEIKGLLLAKYPERTLRAGAQHAGRRVPLGAGS